MKKTICALLLLLALPLAAIGCASGDYGSEPSQQPTQAPPSAPAETAPDVPETNSGEIIVISREDGSGTRGAFIELFGVQDEDKVDRTTLSAEITNSTSVMTTSVAGNDKAIGYISLGSLNSAVKGVEIDGAEATVANIKNGSYGISRPFNLVLTSELSDAAEAFIGFIMSAEGQSVIENGGYIKADEAAAPVSGEAVPGRVVVAGSSSVTPIMDKLKDAYLAINPDAEIEIQQSDSSTGINAAIDGICDIGMASRELKESELEKGARELTIATDGIVVIVSPQSPVNALTKEQVRDIFTGAVTDWSQIG
ncbi:MAG: substrate-binding domain-containing protein [Oscillospiraceae bacterium]|jgi:phosphate transport system substrate-binding protein|nr:substrate-binding domain-containing protein [Oscillospiraceae bacterium]